MTPLSLGPAAGLTIIPVSPTTASLDMPAVVRSTIVGLKYLNQKTVRAAEAAAHSRSCTDSGIPGQGSISRPVTTAPRPNQTMVNEGMKSSAITSSRPKAIQCHQMIDGPMRFTTSCRRLYSPAPWLSIEGRTDRGLPDRDVQDQAEAPVVRFFLECRHVPPDGGITQEHPSQGSSSPRSSPMYCKGATVEGVRTYQIVRRPRARYCSQLRSRVTRVSPRLMACQMISRSKGSR